MSRTVPAAVSNPQGPRPVERTQTAVMRVAPDARLLEVDDTACRWLGYTRDELLGMTVFDINPQADATLWQQHWERLREDKCLAYETVHRRKDGCTYPIELISTHVTAGGEEFAVNVIRDLTALLHDRLQLEALAARLNEAQEIARVGNWERDLRTQQVTWSEQMYRLLGYEPGEIQPTFQWLLEQVHAEDRDKLRTNTDRAIAEASSYELDYRALRRDGETRVMHCRARTICDEMGRPALIAGTLQDTTEVSETARQLRAAVDRLNAAQRVAHVGNWDHDLATDEEEWSDELYRIFGYEPGSVRTTHAFFLGRIHPEDRERVPREVRAAIESGELFTSEFRIVLPDGRVRECHSRGRLERDNTGKAMRMYGTCQDITERRQSESALRRSEEHYRRAAEANRRLLAEVNHRVRNNLTGLLSLLRITREETRDVEEFCNLMRHRITAMTKAHNLLAGAQWHSLDLHTLIRAIAAGYCHTDDHDQRVRLDGPATWVSPRQVVPLALALNELFINAAKHGCYTTPMGRLTVAWRQESHQIVVDWRESDGPPITGDVKPSLGTELINGFICFELNGHIEMTYPREGAQHTIRVPLERIDLPTDATPE